MRKGGWLGKEEGDRRNMKWAHLFSALAGAAGPGYLQEVLGRTGGRPAKHRLEGGCLCL